MEKSNPHEIIRSVAGLFGIAVGLVYLTANPNGWPSWAVVMGWIIIAVGVLLLISGQRIRLRGILDRVHRPAWWFALLKREKAILPPLQFGPTETEDESDNGNFYRVYEIFGEVEMRGTSDQMPIPERLKRIAEWPEITKLSRRLFEHPSFTRSTWDRLTKWLMDHSHRNWGRVIATQRSVIVQLLREAVAEKQKSGVVSGDVTKAITNQELRLWLPVIKATISSPDTALRFLREQINQRGAIDPAVRNLLAEQSFNAGDVLSRLGCLLANGPMFSE